MLVPARLVNTVVWYLNDVVRGVRDFENVEEARHWAGSTLWTALPMPDLRGRLATIAREIDEILRDLKW